MIIHGDNKNSLSINNIILLTKKEMYNAMKKEKQLHLAAVKNEMKNLHYQEKYMKFCMKGRKKQFERKIIIIKNVSKLRYGMDTNF